MMKESLFALRNGCVVLIGVLLCTAPAWAASSQSLEGGKRLYTKNCGSCHGRDAKGDGPLASTLKTKPADLTLLAKKHGGQFPYMDVVDLIDGASSSPSHGGAEMPVWGETFQSDTSSGGNAMDQAMVRGRLMQLTDYLRSIQAQ
ncbi:MAG: cytochrome c [Deltaproteobacteria bacterium]|nr:cytochrome c [Deltaproteobacteria bacterium]MBI3391378.1 cytochrome c [Deltaproteobacteria bacterium]